MKLVVAICIALLPATFAHAAAPTSQPSGDIARRLDDLADRDPAVREQAQQKLMELRREELPALRDAVEYAMPLAPSQAAVLRDIVTHVFLAAEPYDGDPQYGFLGVVLSPIRAGGMILPRLENLELGGSGAGAGVPVLDRLPGFCGFRALRDGDVVMGVVADGLVRTQSKEQLTALVAGTRPGENITLELLRQGRVMRVTIRLDARPSAAAAADARIGGIDELTPIEQLIAERESKAEAYWRAIFLKLLGASLL